jgi:hypothetical protein
MDPMRMLKIDLVPINMTGKNQSKPLPKLISQGSTMKAIFWHLLKLPSRYYHLNSKFFTT